MQGRFRTDSNATVYEISQTAPLTKEPSTSHSVARSVRDILELRLENMWQKVLDADPYRTKGSGQSANNSRSNHLCDTGDTDPSAISSGTADCIQAKVVSLDVLLPVLEAFGCVEGAVIQGWVKQLGELRATDKPLDDYLSFDSDDIIVIHSVAERAGWVVLLSDGSARSVKGKNAAGSAAFDMSRPHQPWILRTSGLVQTNTRAE